MNKQTNLQDVFLNTLRKEKTEVTMFLTNGYQIKGVIRSYDNFVIMIESEGRRQQVVYKHAVSKISPSKPVELNLAVKEEASENTEEE